jgi:hypothetical protein
VVPVSQPDQTGSSSSTGGAATLQNEAGTKNAGMNILLGALSMVFFGAF